MNPLISSRSHPASQDASNLDSLQWRLFAFCRDTGRTTCYRTVFGVLVLLTCAGTLLSQENAAARHRQFLEYLKKAAAEISSQSLTGFSNLEQWKQQRPEMRRQLLYMLGLDPMPKRTALHAQITGVL